MNFRELNDKEVAFLEKEGCFTDSIRVYKNKNGSEYFAFWPEQIFIAYVNTKFLCNGKPVIWKPKFLKEEFVYQWKK